MRCRRRSGIVSQVSWSRRSIRTSDANTRSSRSAASGRWSPWSSAMRRQKWRHDGTISRGSRTMWMKSAFGKTPRIRGTRKVCSGFLSTRRPWCSNWIARRKPSHVAIQRSRSRGARPSSVSYAGSGGGSFGKATVHHGLGRPRLQSASSSSWGRSNPMVMSSMGRRLGSRNPNRSRANCSERTKWLGTPHCTVVGATNAGSQANSSWRSVVPLRQWPRITIGSCSIRAARRPRPHTAHWIPASTSLPRAAAVMPMAR